MNNTAEHTTPLTLIQGALLEGRGHCDVLIENNRIKAIAKDLSVPEGCEVIHAENMLLYPGLVNTHHHIAQSMLKGIPAGLNADLGEWLGAVPYRYWPLFTPETVYAAARIGFAELLASGCTTCADHHYLYHRDTSPEMEEAVFQAASELGMRLVFCRGAATVKGSHRGLQSLNIEVEGLDLCLSRIESLIGKHHQTAEDAMQRVVVAPTSLVHSTPVEHLSIFAAFARHHGLMMHSHLLEVAYDEEVSQRQNGMSAIDVAEQNNWLGEDVWFAHMVHADEQAVKKLGASKTGIAHCPTSNCRLGSGVSPIPALEKAGARISIGVDGSASAESGSMGNELMLSWLIHRAVGGADATTVDTVKRWATSGGASVLGFNELGNIQEGMLADLVLYDLDDPRFFGVWSPEASPVMCGEPIKAQYVMVNGNWSVYEGKVMGLDIEKLKADSQQQLQYLIEKVA